MNFLYMQTNAQSGMKTTRLLRKKIQKQMICLAMCDISLSLTYFGIDIAKHSISVAGFWKMLTPTFAHHFLHALLNSQNS